MIEYFILIFILFYNKKVVKLIGVGIKVVEFGWFYNKGVCLLFLVKIFVRWKF